MSEVIVERFELTEKQKAYVEPFGHTMLGIINSQLHLCCQNPDTHGASIKELTISSEMLLKGLQLNTDIPDGMSLLERFLFLDNNITDHGRASVRMLATIRRMDNFLDEQIIAPYLSGDFSPSEEQEVVLKNIAKIFDRQVAREGNTCLIAQQFAMKIVKYRPKYLSEETIAYITQRYIPLGEKDQAFFMRNDYDMADVLQVLVLSLRAGIFEHEQKQLQVPDTTESSSGEAQFWNKMVAQYIAYMLLRSGKEAPEAFPEDIKAAQEGEVGARLLSLRRMLQEQAT